jgi:transposase
MGYFKFIDSAVKKPGVTGEDFIIYLNGLVQQLPPNSLLIIDNAKIHHTDDVHRFIETLNKGRDVQVLFLPPYSPFLNPIEYAFAKIKEIVGRSEYQNKAQLKVEIEHALEQITQNDIQNWISHTHKYFGQCIVGLPFHGRASLS